MEEMTVNISRNIFQLNSHPVISRRLSFFSIRGIPPSSVPAGQIYWQKYGGAIPKGLARNMGNNMTGTASITYFRYRRGFSFAVENFLPGILCRQITV